MKYLIEIVVIISKPYYPDEELSYILLVSALNKDDANAKAKKHVKSLVTHTLAGKETVEIYINKTTVYMVVE